MYVPPHFAEARHDVLHQFIREHPFATVVAATSAGLEAQHVPLLFDADDGRSGVLQGHVARANPIWRTLANGAEVLAVFVGPNHYISPSWYPSKHEHGRVVPTWNYIAVQVRGVLAWQHDRDWLLDLLEKTTRAHEEKRLHPWALTDAPKEHIERLLRGVVGLEISISAITGKWKMSQHQDIADRAGAISGLEDEPGAQAAEVAKWMRACTD